MPIIEQLSDEPRKALIQGNSLATEWTRPLIGGVDPLTLYADGVIEAVKGPGVLTPSRLFLMPYCEGPSGSQFSMRVYGWRKLKRPDNIDLGTSPPGAGNAGIVVPNPATSPYGVWLWYLLCELACTACNAPGPPLGGPNLTQPYLLRPTENLCDTLALGTGPNGPNGALGLTGLINSTGPGTDLPAHAMVELGGAQRWSWDFCRANADNITMNCLYARA